MPLTSTWTTRKLVRMSSDLAPLEVHLVILQGLIERLDRTARLTTKPVLTEMEQALLFALGERGRANQRALAAHLGVDAAWVSRNLAALVALGLVRRSDPDKRTSPAELTRKGIGAAAAHRQAREAFWAQIRVELSAPPATVAALADLNRAIQRVFDAGVAAAQRS